jgi:NADPH:quinone reductase-like Zn-dependent oxidoreductase
MRAAFHLQTGGPEVLQVAEQPDPRCGPNDVLLRVRASSLDRVDVYGREGSHGMKWPTPYVGGRDIGGTIVEAGSEAQKSFPSLTPGTQVIAMGDRAHAELALAPALMVFPLPRGLDVVSAAAIPTAGRTAYDALIHRVEIRPGEDVLIFAGGSGVGSFGIQIARAAGCRVITTVGSADKKKQALELGAHHAIDHYTEDVAARVKEITGGQGVHAVLDHVGTPVWEAAFASLRPFGRFVTTGVTAGHRVSLHLGQMFVKGTKVMGIGRSDRPEMRKSMLELLRLVEQGAVKPVVAATFPLESIADAHRLMESSKFFGKIVVTNDAA